MGNYLLCVMQTEIAKNLEDGTEGYGNIKKDQK
jgi:hypothetical protein